MLLSLPRRGFLWPRFADMTPSTLCLHCKRRWQHSAALESPVEVLEGAAERQQEPQSPQPPRGTHPPRPPRRYIERRHRDVPLRSLQFLQQGPRPRPTPPSQSAKFPQAGTWNTRDKPNSQNMNKAMQTDIDLVASVYFYSLNTAHK